MHNSTDKSIIILRVDIKLKEIRLKNFIEINGYKYDTQTGNLLSKPNRGNIRKTLTTAKKYTGAIDIVNGPVAKKDGFNYNKNSPTKLIHKIRKPASIKNTASRKQRSLALNRSTVIKPNKKAQYITAKTKPLQRTMGSIKEEKALIKVPAKRLQRAVTLQKSDKIRKFNNNRPSIALIKDDIRVHHKKKIKKDESRKTYSLNRIDNIVDSNFSSNSRANYNTKKTNEKNSFQKATGRFLYKKKLISALTIFLSVIILVAFLSYQRVPNVAIKLAANRAGFSAVNPDNVPSGFSYKSPIEIDDKTIKITYKNSQSMQYTVSQQPSFWTDESLLSGFLKSSTYQTYYDDNLTVYVYGNSNATWLKDGLWFNLVSNGALSREQLLSIASST